MFPLPGTQSTRYYLDAASGALATVCPENEAVASLEALGDGVSFTTEPFAADTEFTGFITAHLWVSSSTDDMDLFAVLRMIDADGKELIINGAHEASPVSRGWLRVSHRRLDSNRSSALRPFHAHDKIEPLVPGEVYEVDLEIWPTSMVYPKGYRMVLTIMGKDFEFPDIPGRILHKHESDRGHEAFKGNSRILTGGDRASYVTLPRFPASSTTTIAWSRRMQVRRVVTGHKPNGEGTILIDEPSKDVVSFRPGATIWNIWSALLPAVNNDAADGAKQIVGTAMKGRSVFRVIEYAPGVSPRIHRTDSIDYAIVLSGEITMELDHENVLLRAGDVLVQRGTIHNWVNRSDAPCVIAFVLIDATPVTIAGSEMSALG